jgi:TPR repeat protein
MRAAETGLAEAQFALGTCYTRGCGVAIDDGEAIKWYKRAAEAGLMEAQFALGVCYAEGSGVAVDRTEAIKWWTEGT